MNAALQKKLVTQLRSFEKRFAKKIAKAKAEQSDSFEEFVTHTATEFRAAYQAEVARIISLMTVEERLALGDEMVAQNVRHVANEALMRDATKHLATKGGDPIETILGGLLSALESSSSGHPPVPGACPDCGEIHGGAHSGLPPIKGNPSRN